MIVTASLSCIVNCDDGSIVAVEDCDCTTSTVDDDGDVVEVFVTVTSDLWTKDVPPTFKRRWCWSSRR